MNKVQVCVIVIVYSLVHIAELCRNKIKKPVLFYYVKGILLLLLLYIYYNRIEFLCIHLTARFGVKNIKMFLKFI